MKRFSTILISILPFLTACSSIQHYKPSSQNELATTSYRNVRLLNDQNHSELVLSTIYLNQVFPKYADNYAHFLVSFYNPASDNKLYFDSNCTETALVSSEENRTVSDLADSNSTLVQEQSSSCKENTNRYVLLLNGEGALVSEQLESDDLLLELMPINNSWNRYYYVRYALPNAKPVLRLENDHTVKAVIAY